MVHRPSGPRREGEEPTPSERTSSSRRQNNAAEDYKGLCVTCGKRDACVHPRSEGGIWHCREYVEAR